MPTYSVDLVLDVYKSVSTSTAIGTKSVYGSVPHPGTGNVIKGWEWDKRTWPTDLELKATDYAPTIFDPDTNFIPEDKFLSGIGDNNDLKVLQVAEEQASNIRYWTPRIEHGYFYVQDQEWYLYSDDAVRDLFDASVISGVLQYKDLEFKPKPGIPISVRRYRWNTEEARYEIDLNLRKKLEFTGIVHNDTEEETFASGNYITGNIDTSKDEFVLEYDSTPNRVVLNRNYEDQVGTSGTLSSLEFIGISDGTTNEYHLPYAPVSPSGLIQLITWDDRIDTTYSWSRIDQTAEFTQGPYQEYKLDDHLGIITFGDYDPVTTSGSGARPGNLHKIGLVYTRGLELIYEPERSRDWVEPRSADVSPFHNPINQGFVKVSAQVATPQWIQLTADLEGDSVDGYEIDLSNVTGLLTAKVLGSDGVPMERQNVTFEILTPTFGTFPNLELDISALSNRDGEAHAEYVPPTTIEEIGRATRTVTTISGVRSIVTVEGLVAPETREEIYLYQVKVDDEVLGVPASGETTRYLTYLDNEGIDEEPSGSAALAATEESFREAHGLLTPTFYESDDITTGAKVIVASVDPGVLDPNYAIQKPTTLAPILPYEFTSGTIEAPVLELTYSGVLPLPDNATFKSYFVACSAKTRVRAKVINPVSGRVIYSNVIEITIRIPEEASGVKLIDELSDLETSLIQRVKHIDDISDAAVLTTRGELWSEYQEDRLYVEDENDYAQWQSDSHTIGYWPLESSGGSALVDFSTYGNNLTNVGGMVSVAGFLGDGMKSNSPGTLQYLDAAGLFGDLNLVSGTIDMLIKSNTTIASGVDYRFFDITLSGSNSRRNRLMGQVENSAASGTTFRFNYEISGVGNPTAYLVGDLAANGIDLGDQDWHSLRVTWDVNTATNRVILGAEVDGVTISGGVPTATLPVLPHIGTPIGGRLQAVAGDLSSLGQFSFDEIRYSDTVRTDSWPHVEVTQSGESYIDWFRRTRRADSAQLLLENVTYSGYLPARLPMGFRLKSTGITVASMLDKVTFLTLNDPLPDDYFN